MDPIRITADSKLIKVLADQVQNKRVDSAAADEAQEIFHTLAQQENTKEVIHTIGQTVAYTMNDIHQNSLGFLESIADTKRCNFGEKIAFNMQTGGINAVIQAKGSTTPRSYVASRQLFIDTIEVSSRPAINIMELRCNRVNMPDLVRQANEQMVLKETGYIEDVLHKAVAEFHSPFYGSANGIDTTILDKQLEYFRRLGPVTIVGDIAAVSQLIGVQGMVGANGNGTVAYSDDQMNEYASTGMLGKYKGSTVISMPNAYETGKTTPIMKTNWLYLVPGNISVDLHNLKILYEGGVNSFEAQNINDLVYEIRLDQWFGAAFVTNKIPNIGAYKIN